MGKYRLFYHVTLKEKLPSILKEGLVPVKSSTNKRACVYLWAKLSFAIAMLYNFERDSVILKVRIPNSWIEKDTRYYDGVYGDPEYGSAFKCFHRITKTKICQILNIDRNQVMKSKNSPNDKITLNRRGLVFYALRKYQEAIEEFDKAIVLDPIESDFHNNKGLALAKIGLYEMALYEYNKAITVNPNNVLYVYNKANVLSKLKKYQEALREYDKIIDLRPNDPDFYNNRGVTLLYLNNFKEALDEFNKARRLDDKDPYIHFNKGIALLSLKRFKSSLKEFEKAIELDPNNQEFKDSVKKLYILEYSFQRDLVDDLSKETRN